MTAVANRRDRVFLFSVHVYHYVCRRHMRLKKSKIRKIVPINKTFLSDHNSMKRKLVHSIDIKYARSLIINIYSNLISRIYFV
jgi:hypothetical protein